MSLPHFDTLLTGGLSDQFFYNTEFLGPPLNFNMVRALCRRTTRPPLSTPHERNSSRTFTKIVIKDVRAIGLFYMIKTEF